MYKRQRFYPQSFTIEAITVDLGFEGVSMEPIQKLCDELGIHYTQMCIRDSHEEDLNTLKTLVQAAVLLVIPLALVYSQPDMKNTRCV